MRQIEFRGLRTDGKGWATGFYTRNAFDGTSRILEYAIIPFDGNNSYYPIEVRPETVGQFTGLHDKDGNKIWEGDIVEYNRPYRTTQTHYGNNIPNGQYTEPLEPGIETIEGEVIFNDSAFQLKISGREDSYPLSWSDIYWDLESIKGAISWRREDADLFDDPEEGDLQYLIKECAGVDTAEELIEYLNGFTITGNIHESPELINQK